jgi:hypothetical protein
MVHDENYWADKLIEAIHEPFLYGADCHLQEQQMYQHMTVR